MFHSIRTWYSKCNHNTDFDTEFCDYINWTSIFCDLKSYYRNSGLFGIVWFILVLLYFSNIECIKLGSAHVIFALVVWCISAVQILKD